jgi:hypothetical protein
MKKEMKNRIGVSEKSGHIILYSGSDALLLFSVVLLLVIMNRFGGNSIAIRVYLRSPLYCI